MRKRSFRRAWARKAVAFGLCAAMTMPSSAAYLGTAVTAAASEDDEVAALDATEEPDTTDEPADSAAGISLTAEGNKVYINIDEADWVYYNLEVTWNAGVALADAESGARATDALKLAVAGGKDGIGVQVYNDTVAGEFYASGAFTTDTGGGCDFAGTAYILEFDTDKELVVTCGEQSVTINTTSSEAPTTEPTTSSTPATSDEPSEAPATEPAASEEPTTTDEPTATPEPELTDEPIESETPDEGAASISLTAEGNKVYVNIDEAGWNTLNTEITWDSSVALVSASGGGRATTEFKKIFHEENVTGIQIYNDTEAGLFVAGAAWTTTTGDMCDFTGTAYILEFDTDKELVVTCGEQSVTINTTSSEAPTTEPTTSSTPATSDEPSEAPATEPAASEEPTAAPSETPGAEPAASEEPTPTDEPSEAPATEPAASDEPTEPTEAPGTEPTTEPTATPDGDYVVEDTSAGAAIEKYTGTETEVTLPEEIGGVKVTTILTAAFSGTDVKKVVVSSTVTVIAEKAFVSCTNLVSITIPSSVTEIGEDAFAGCENLTISCYQDSVAYQYAKANGIPVLLLDEPTAAPSETPGAEPAASEEPTPTDEPSEAPATEPASILYGDADENGKVEASDALAVLKSVVKLTTLSDSQTTAADVDGDGMVTASDALLILKKVVQLLDVFPVETAQKQV